MNNCLSLSLAVEDFLFHEMEIHTRLIVIITFFYLREMLSNNRSKDI